MQIVELNKEEVLLVGGGMEKEKHSAETYRPLVVLAAGLFGLFIGNYLGLKNFCPNTQSAKARIWQLTKLTILSAAAALTAIATSLKIF